MTPPVGDGFAGPSTVGDALILLTAVAAGPPIGATAATAMCNRGSIAGAGVGRGATSVRGEGERALGVVKDKRQAVVGNSSVFIPQKGCGSTGCMRAGGRVYNNTWLLT